MSYHVIVLERSGPVTFSCGKAPVPPCNLGSREFHRIRDEAEIIFYDFLVKGSDIRALQVQIGEDDCQARHLVNGLRAARLPYVTFAPCLQIWLDECHDADEVGVEAFGDLLLLQAADETFAIGYSTSWLDGRNLQ